MEVISIGDYTLLYDSINSKGYKLSSALDQDLNICKVWVEFGGITNRTSKGRTYKVYQFNIKEKGVRKSIVRSIKKE